MSGSAVEVAGFVLEELLGLGSFGAVYKGTRRSPSTIPPPHCPSTVAVKVVPLSKLDANTKKALENEITLQQQLSHHAHIAKLYFATRSARYIFLFFELLSGGDLSHHLKESLEGPKARPLPVSVVQKAIRHLASAMHELWKRNILHRDLKPSNLIASEPDLFSPSCRIVLSDFGFARELDDASSTAMAATLCGSPLYMAPELLRGQKYTARADLWSLAVLMVELLTGKTPFTGRTPLELLRNIEASRWASLDPKRVPLRSPSAAALDEEDPFTWPEHLQDNCGGTLNPPSLEVLAEIPYQCRDLLFRLLRRQPSHRIGFLEFFRHPFVDLPEARPPEPSPSPSIQQKQQAASLPALAAPGLPTAADSAVVAAADTSTAAAAEKGKPDAEESPVPPPESRALLRGLQLASMAEDVVAANATARGERAGPPPGVVIATAGSRRASISRAHGEEEEEDKLKQERDKDARERTMTTTAAPDLTAASALLEELLGLPSAFGTGSVAAFAAAAADSRQLRRRKAATAATGSEGSPRAKGSAAASSSSSVSDEAAARSALPPPKEDAESGEDADWAVVDIVDIDIDDGLFDQNGRVATNSKGGLASSLSHRGSTAQIGRGSPLVAGGSELIAQEEDEEADGGVLISVVRRAGTAAVPPPKASPRPAPAAPPPPLPQSTVLVLSAEAKKEAEGRRQKLETAIAKVQQELLAGERSLRTAAVAVSFLVPHASLPSEALAALGLPSSVRPSLETSFGLICKAVEAALLGLSGVSVEGKGGEGTEEEDGTTEEGQRLLADAVSRWPCLLSSKSKSDRNRRISSTGAEMQAEEAIESLRSLAEESLLSLRSAEAVLTVEIPEEEEKEPGLGESAATAAANELRAALRRDLNAVEGLLGKLRGKRQEMQPGRAMTAELQD